jgi:hypothetical protein
MMIEQVGNYGGISMLPTTYKILSNILLSRLTPFVDGITRNLLLRVQAGSGAHPASYPMGTGDSFPGGKAAGA